MAWVNVPSPAMRRQPHDPHCPPLASVYSPQAASVSSPASTSTGKALGHRAGRDSQEGVAGNSGNLWLRNLGNLSQKKYRGIFLLAF